MDAKKTKAVAGTVETKEERDLTGLENMFREVVINAGTVYITVDGQAKTVKREMVNNYGPRKNVRTNTERLAEHLALRRLRQMFDLKGRHLALKFIQFVDGKLQDERGHEIIHYMPQAK